MVPDLLFYGGTERRDRTVEFLALGISLAWKS